MKGKLIVFCSVITATLGAVVGYGLAEMSQNQYESSLYRHMHLKLAIAGAVVGALAGAGQECVRELKEEDFDSLDDYSRTNH